MQACIACKRMHTCRHTSAVDIIELSCIFPGWAWPSNFTFQLLLPLFVGGLVGLNFCGSWLLWCLKGADGSGCKTFGYKVLRTFFVEPLSQEHLTEVACSKVSTVLAFISMIYLTVCKYSLQPFQCAPLFFEVYLQHY